MDAEQRAEREAKREAWREERAAMDAIDAQLDAWWNNQARASAAVMRSIGIPL
jgi:hypothetical protein